MSKPETVFLVWEGSQYQNILLGVFLTRDEAITAQEKGQQHTEGRLWVEEFFVGRLLMR